MKKKDLFAALGDKKIYLSPAGFASVDLGKKLYSQGQAGLISNSGFYYTACEVFIKNKENIEKFCLTFQKAKEHQALCEIIKKIEKPKPKFANLDLSEPVIMGILNLTPDSFSDGGDYNNLEKAKKRAFEQIKKGSKIIDVGGESTRPNADEVPVEKEIKRVVPVIKELRDENVIISCDTRHSEVMEEAIKAGAHVINDVSALSCEKSIEIIKKHNIPVVLMHMKGTPKNMQKKPSYNFAPIDIYDYFEEKIQRLEKIGINRNNMCIDVGIGFGKNDEHNMSLLKHMAMFSALGCPIMLGSSRKSFISRLTKNAQEPKDRLSGTIASMLDAIKAGVNIFRVHDVFETKQAFDIFREISKAD